MGLSGLDNRGLSACELSLDEVTQVRAKELRLAREIAQLGSVMIAYSGGVDSSLLAHYARKELGNAATIVIAVSPSLAEEELAAAREQARLFGWNLEEIATDEVSKP